MKTHWKKLDNPNYLGSYSLLGMDYPKITLTIKEVKVEKVHNGKTEEECKVAYWIEDEKPMILNTTNCKNIEHIAGSPFIEDWPNTSVTVYIAKVNAFGEMVDALRITAGKKLPELTPEHEKWDAVVQALQGGHTINQVKSKYSLTQENEEFFEDEYFIGTPDVIMKHQVIDTKCSWDCFTFPLFSDLDPSYYGQGQVYMHLTDRKHFKVIYLLLDTPLHLIEREARYYAKKNGYEEVDAEMFEKFENHMTYGEIDDKHKIKEFAFDYDKNYIEELQRRVVLCREYIKSLKY